MFPRSRAARPAHPPWRGRRGAKGPECGRWAPCRALAVRQALGRPSLVRAGGRAGLAPGRAFGRTELVWSSRCSIYLFIF